MVDVLRLTTRIWFIAIAKKNKSFANIGSIMLNMILIITVDNLS